LPNKQTNCVQIGISSAVVYTDESNFYCLISCSFCGFMLAALFCSNKLKQQRHLAVSFSCIYAGIVRERFLT